VAPDRVKVVPASKQPPQKPSAGIVYKRPGDKPGPPPAPVTKAPSPTVTPPSSSNVAASAAPKKVAVAPPPAKKAAAPPVALLDSLLQDMTSSKRPKK
jgi:hypothetical protein